jgi:PAS domain S-box-containing protein
MNRTARHNAFADPELEGDPKRLQALFDGIDEVIYVTDPTTYEILFANKMIKDMFGAGVIGKKCYKIFQGLNKPCPFCTNRHILGRNLGKTYKWEFQNRQNKHWYKCIDKAIRWSGDKYARYEVAIDITERKKMEELLREKEEFFRSVAENSVNAILVIDDKFRITYMNNEAERISGYSRKETINHDFRKYLSEESRSLVQERYLQRQRGEKIPPIYEFKIVRKDGQKIDVEVKSEIMHCQNVKIATVVQLVDITDRKKMEQERKQFTERLGALNLCGGKLNAAKTFNDIYELTLDAMERTLGFAHAAYLAIDRRCLRPVCQRGYSTPLTFELPLDGTRRGITVRAAMSGKPVLVPDTTKDGDYVKGATCTPPVRSELAVPVKAENEVLGILNVESKELNGFDEQDMMLLQILASHAAIAVTNMRRRDQLRRLSDGLQNFMKSTVQVMHAKSMSQKLQIMTRAVQRFGWRRVVISLRDENLEGTAVVAAGLTPEEKHLLTQRKAPGHVWKERLGPKFQKYKIGEFYYLPWNDSWIRENVHGVSPETSPDEATTYAGVPSSLSPEDMVDWHPQDMLYAPLLTPEGRVVGILSMDDPVDGRKPTKETLTPLELFLHKSAIAIENAQLIESLKDAREQLQAYADQLEQKVENRTHALRLSQEQLLKAQRLAVVGELAGMVGHDLRNPLTGIAGATYYVKKRLASKIDGKISEMLELIEKNIEYSNKIINDLLEYSREIRLELTETTPKVMIKEALRLVEIPKNVQLTDFTRNKPKISVDMEKLTRAFVNIIKNALDAMAKGGSLTIRSRKDGDHMQFVFSDTGMGMTKETVSKIWTPLFTTKARGMGFGLPICKRIIEAHGGTITVQSMVKKGTTFTITVPYKQRTTEGGEEIWVITPESSSLMMTKT